MVANRSSQAVQTDPSAPSAPAGPAHRSAGVAGDRRRAVQAAERSVRLPGEDLSLNEMLRVMDVAREMRRNRVVAEEMFRRDEVRAELRDKLMRTAQIAGDQVTVAEIDAAIDQYFTNLHAYADPPGGFQRFVAHAWVWRNRIAAAGIALAAALGALSFLFF